MKYLLTIFFIFLTCNLLFGQEFTSVYADAYALYNVGKYKEAIPVAQSALELAINKNSNKSIETANSLDLIGRIYDNLDDYKLAIPFYQKATETIRSLSQPDTVLAKYLYRYGFCLYENKQYPDAIILLNECILLCRKANYTSKNLFANMINALAQAYTFSGQYLQAEPLAIENYQFWHLKQTESLDKANSANNLGLLYHFKGNLSDALPYYKEAIAIKRKLAEIPIQDLTTSIKNLANLYIALSDLPKADSSYRKVIQLLSKLPGGEARDDYISANIELANAFLQFNRLNDAKALYISSLGIIMKNGGASNPQFIRCLTSMADLFSQFREYGKADTILQQALKVKLATDGKYALRTAYIKDRLGVLYQYMKRTKEAEIFLLESDSVYIKTEGVNSLDHAHSLGNLGLVYQQAGRIRDALLLHRSSLAIVKTISAIPTKDYLIELGNYGDCALQLANWPLADSIYKAAVEICNQQKWMNTKAYVWSLNGLATVEKRTGFNLQALGHLEKAINIWQSITTADDPDGVQLFEDYSDLYYDIGNLSLAMLYANKALVINENHFGKNSVQYASSLLKLVDVDIVNGDFSKASSKLDTVLSIQRNAFGENHPIYGLTLATYGRVQGYSQKKEEAEKNFLKAIKIFEDTENGTKGIEFLKIIANFSSFYTQDGQNDKAEPFAIRALDLAQKIYGSDNDNLIIYQNSLALIYINLNKLKDAENLFQLIRKSTAERSMPAVFATAMNNLGSLYISQKEYAKAEAQLRFSVDKFKEIYGDQSIIYSKALFNLAAITYIENKYSASEDAYSRALPIKFSNAQFNLTGLSSEEKVNWWQQANLEAQFGPVLLTIDPSVSAQFTQLVCEEQLMLKAYLLNDEAKQLLKAYSSADLTTRQRFNDWQTARTELVAQYNLPKSKRIIEIDSLRKLVTDGEKSFSSGIFMGNTSKQLTIDEISRALKINETAIEFIRYGFFKPTLEKSFKYAAIVLVYGDSTAHFVPICDEEKLKTLLANTSYSSNADFEGLYGITKSGNNALFDMVIQPLLPYLANTSTLIFSPAGLLNRVSFRALPMKNGQLFSEAFQLRQVLSIKEISDSSESSIATNNGWLLYGGIDYDKSVKINNPSELETIPAFLRPGVKLGAWPYLQGTLSEVKQISVLLSNAHIKVQIRTDTAATKLSFLSISGKSPEVLHIATHGYFLPEAESVELPDDNPLFRSGLIMAGANTRDDNGAKVGILTAYEVSNIDLSNTHLVILSACETALGDLRGTEGVFGLQRAFRLAGVKQMIISLWKVPDQQTSELMINFYGKLIKGASVNSAFSAAQKDMSRKYPPYYWAAFELIE